MDEERASDLGSPAQMESIQNWKEGLKALSSTRLKNMDLYYELIFPSWRR
jgi:hypothetical protein